MVNLVCLPRTLVTKDRKSTRLNSSHVAISYAVFCLKKKQHLCDGPTARNSICGKAGHQKLAAQSQANIQRCFGSVVGIAPLSSSRAIFFLNNTETTEISPLSPPTPFPI